MERFIGRKERISYICLVNIRISTFCCEMNVIVNSEQINIFLVTYVSIIKKNYIAVSSSNIMIKRFLISRLTLAQKKYEPFAHENDALTARPLYFKIKLVAVKLLIYSDFQFIRVTSIAGKIKQQKIKRIP